MKIFSTIIITTVCLCASAHQLTAQEYSRSNWRDKDIAIDGRTDEWGLPLNYYDAKTKIQYSMVNDKDYLYICMAMTDEASQMKILRGGLELWIDTGGHKKQQIGVMFPLPYVRNNNPAQGKNNPDGDMPPTSDGSRGGGRRPDAREMVSELHECKFIGFKGVPTGTEEITDTNKIKIAMKLAPSNGFMVMVYEIKIPINTFYRPLQASDTNKNFGLILKVNGLTQPEHKASEGSGSGQGGGMGGHGGGGMGGGGMGGGGGRGGGGGGMRQSTANPELYEADVFHGKFRLSLK